MKRSKIKKLKDQKSKDPSKISSTIQVQEFIHRRHSGSNELKINRSKSQEK